MQVPCIHAIVSPIPLAATCPAQFTTITAALAAAPAGSGDYVIGLMPGTYSEKIEIERPNVTLLGCGTHNTFIEHNCSSGDLRPDGQRWMTSGCATVIVRSPGFRAAHLSIANNYDFDRNDVLAETDPARNSGPQAVALMLAQGSDQATLDHVALQGYQDTLFADAGRSYFCQCQISGHIDFIFGAGQAWLEQCDIVTRARLKPIQPVGYITAPSTDRQSAYGLVFSKCRLLREKGVPNASVPLGRPWHPTRNFPDGRYADPNAMGMSVFLSCWLDAHITPAGWDMMAGTGRQPGTRSWFFPEDARFFESGSQGPGAMVTPNRRQLSPEQALQFTSTHVLAGWQPPPSLAALTPA